MRERPQRIQSSATQTDNVRANPKNALVKRLIRREELREKFKKGEMKMYRMTFWMEGPRKCRDYEKDFEAQSDNAAVEMAKDHIKKVQETHPLYDCGLSELHRIDEGVETKIEFSPV